nr:uncharacterized protein LOC129268791 [Lytechinus pictus]
MIIMEQEGRQVCVILWCYPRTLSTVLTKCLSFIEDIEVWFEPFTYCDIPNILYRAETGKDLPPEYTAENAGEFAAAVRLFVEQLGVSPSSIEPERIAYGSVKQRLDSTQSKFVLVKDMSVALRDETLRKYIPSGYQHVFLIREPMSAFHSYRKACIIRDKPKDESSYDVVRDDAYLTADEFFPSLHSLWKYVRHNIDPNPMVINADDLKTDPGAVLKKFCEKTGLPYSDSLLRWDASTKVVKTWKACGETLLHDVPIFFLDAATSSEFVASASKPVTWEELTEDVLRLVDAALPLYQEMNEYKV